MNEEYTDSVVTNSWEGLTTSGGIYRLIIIHKSFIDYLKTPKRTLYRHHIPVSYTHLDVYKRQELHIYDISRNLNNKVYVIRNMVKS